MLDVYRMLMSVLQIPALIVENVKMGSINLSVIVHQVITEKDVKVISMNASLTLVNTVEYAQMDSTLIRVNACQVTQAEIVSTILTIV